MSNPNPSYNPFKDSQLYRHNGLNGEAQFKGVFYIRLSDPFSGVELTEQDKKFGHVEPLEVGENEDGDQVYLATIDGSFQQEKNKHLFKAWGGYTWCGSQEDFEQNFTKIEKNKKP